MLEGVVLYMQGYYARIIFVPVTAFLACFFVFKFVIRVCGGASTIASRLIVFVYACAARIRAQYIAPHNFIWTKIDIIYEL